MEYKRFVFRKLDSPRYFFGLWPVGVCVWRDWAVTIQWNGWNHKYWSEKGE